MGIFGRLAQLIKSNLNDLISKSEDPEKMLNQVILEMDQQLIEAKKQVALAIADEKKLSKQLEAEKALASEWERKAMMAVRAGEDNLAKEALSRKQEHDELATEYDKQWQKQSQAVGALRRQLDILNSKIGEARRKKAVLIARKKRADAAKMIQETIAGMSENNSFDTFKRMEEKVNQAEAEADAQAELNNEYTGDQLQQKFNQLEQSRGADEALLALKAKMGMAGSAPAEQASAPAAEVRVRAEPEPQAAATGTEEQELEQVVAQAAQRRRVNQGS